MFTSIACVVLVIALLSVYTHAFSAGSSLALRKGAGLLTMEYIPSGLSKTQWAALKAKEKADADAKKNGSLGASRFKSRSFEAWQKAGSKHLFPVDPTTTSYEERPYMQRKDGDWEGKDLTAKGLAGRGQGAASKRLALDNDYERMKKEGKLDSVSIFGGANLPWTNAQASKIGKESDPRKNQPVGVAGKKLSEAEMRLLKANLAKVKDSTKDKKVSAAPEEKKKGFFGLF